MRAKGVARRVRKETLAWSLMAGVLLFVILAGLAFFRNVRLAAVINLAESFLPTQCHQRKLESDPQTNLTSPLPNSQRIPVQNEWGAPQIVIEPGPIGSWDVVLWGAISPAAVVKKDGTYFLYYIGADGYRSTDGDARHRALGVATSTDGIQFTRYAGNPILTHLPHSNEEEGIFSVGASLDPAGNIVLYYGAMDAGNADSEWVDGDVRLAISSDGLRFTEVGDVLSHTDSNVWGYGDELFPVGTFHANNSWHVYYIAKGHNAYWDLGMASGTTPHLLSDTQAVLTAGSDIMGGGDAVQLNDSEIALFLVRDFEHRCIEGRLIHTDLPAHLSEPVVIYDFGDHWGNTTFLFDQQSGVWFMYQLNLNDDNIYVRTVPIGTTP